jgi:hypothetical protein
MSNWSLLIGCWILTSSAWAAQGVLILAEEGGIDAPSASTLRRITESQLRARGVSLLEDARFSRPRPLDNETLRLAQQGNLSKAYVLQPSRLGSKILLTLQERDVNSGELVYEVSLAAQSLEESDRIIPRLVSALVDRKKVEASAEVGSVTREEAAPFQKKPGETFWTFGLPFGLTGGGTSGAFGLSAAYNYEAEYFRVAFDVLGTGSKDFGAFLLGIDASWIPMAGDWSPYLGAGVGYMHVSENGYSAGGAGLTSEVGLEFLRLRKVRILVGAQGLLPLYSLRSTTSTNTKWLPLFLLHARVAF